MDKRFLVIVLVVAVAIAAGSMLLPRRAEVADARAINVGAPSDTGGLVAVELARTSTVRGRAIEAYPLKDCCATKTEYALSVDLLDAAIMCPDAAARLVARDDRYVVVGPLVRNSDVIISRGGAVKSVALSQRRAYQEDAARAAFGEDTVLRPMLSSAIAYAIERAEVDAAVMDVLDARAIDRPKRSIAEASGDITTYELVVTRELMADPAYAEFLALISRTVNDLNDIEHLKAAVEARTGVPLSTEEVKAWKQAGTRFVAPQG